jgi:hypothetical protein
MVSSTKLAAHRERGADVLLAFAAPYARARVRPTPRDAQIAGSRSLERRTRRTEARAVL